MKTILRSLFGKQSNNGDHVASVPAEESHAGQGGRRVALQGDIAAIALEDIFQLFDFAALTGKLEVHSPINSGSFFFRNGVLTYGMLQVNQRRIGEILLQSGIITEMQLQECLQVHEASSPPRRFGQILMEQGYIQAEMLDDSLLSQVKDAFFETLSWQEGTFSFYQNETPASEEVQLYARIDHLLLEGMVYLDNTKAGDL